MSAAPAGAPPETSDAKHATPTGNPLDGVLRHRLPPPRLHPLRRC
ncbi:hypothetical protein [Bacteriophage sp.]|nr:hypothetical protein [Bacteriophage sp.]